MQAGRFDPSKLTPAAREGYAEPRVDEYLTSGVSTTNPRTLDTYCVTFGSLRRIANAAGLTTPFAQMTETDVKVLARLIRKTENPRPYEVQIRSFFKYLEREDLRKWIKPSKPKGTMVGPDNILTIDEVNRLLEAADSKRDRVLIAALFETGGRISEVLSLNIESMKRHENGKAWYSAWFGRMKEPGTEHTVYFREAATVALLDDWFRNYPAEVSATPRPLIPSLSHASNDEQRLGKDSIGPLLRAAAEKSGVSQRVHVHPHLFRHLKCTLLLREGLSIALINKAMGWKPRSMMSARYGHLVTEDVEVALGLKAKGEGEKAELLVPKREVPAMPAVPFPANSAAARRLAQLEQRMDQLTTAKPEVRTIEDLRERMNLASKITEAEWDAMSPAEQNVAALEQERDEMRERMAAMERTLAALLKKEA